MLHASTSTIAKTLNVKPVAAPRLWKFHLAISRKSFSSRIQMDNNCKDNSRGALVVLEGLDRSGKTSQCSRLVSYLKSQGHSVESWRFPDRSTSVGQMISSYLSNESNLDDRTVHLLFSANRWEKRSLMENKLKSGTTLIVDRYSYSGVAFSSGKGLDIEWCKAPEAGLLAPDLVLYLDIPPEVVFTFENIFLSKSVKNNNKALTVYYKYFLGMFIVQAEDPPEDSVQILKAAERGGYGGERYEQLEFQKKVAQHYMILRDASWKIVDACLPVEDVEKQLTECVLDCMTTCQKGKLFSQLWL